MKELGPVVPIVTPCKRDGTIDVEGFKSICNEMVNAGAKGIFIGGSTGRGPWFSLNDRITLCRTAADCIENSNVLLMAGCTALGLPDMIEAARAMADAGAVAAVATVPGYFKYNHNEIIRIFRDFAENSPLPVVLYDIPDFTRVKINQDVIFELAKHKNVIGFKDSTNDFNRFQILIEYFKNRDDFYLLQGKEHWLSKSLQLKASGFVVSMIHIDPDLFVGLYNAMQQGDLIRAEILQGVVDRLMDIVAKMFERRAETSTLFHFINQVLKLRNVCENIVLEQDGECPDWLSRLAEEAYFMCKSATSEYLQK